MATHVPITTHPEVAGLPPGVYERLSQSARPVGVRLDVAAFVGLTERGPVGKAVGVGSATEFGAAFGRRGGARQLPDSVHLFFANGGRRAVVVRAVGPAAVATEGLLEGVVAAGTTSPIRLVAADRGGWGNELRVGWQWALAPLTAQPTPTGVPSAAAPPVGTLLRTTVTDSPPGTTAEVLRFVVAHQVQADGTTVLLLDAPMPVPPAGAVMAPWEELRGTLHARWADHTEVFPHVAVDPAHPNWLGNSLTGSRLVRLSDTSQRWIPEASLLGLGSMLRQHQWAIDITGTDGSTTTSRSVFVPASPGGPLDALQTWDDAHEAEPVAMVALPDLMHLGADLDPVTVEPEGGDTRFGTCVRPEPETTKAADLEWPLLSIGIAGAMEEISLLQTALVEHCAPRRRMTLLDLPPGLDRGEILAWRAAHASDHAAAYAPWLKIVREDRLFTTPPCGVAAGVIARREREAGVHAAPANVLVVGVVGPADDPLLPDAGLLHQERIDALRVTERGLAVMGARTTSFDGDWTHINVRRVVDWLARQLTLDAQWAVFEPNAHRLWRRLTRMVEKRLLSLGAAGAWAGATAAESWFVRCDATTNRPEDREAGRVVVQVGVAPSVPAEFIVFELALVVGDGTHG